MRRRLGKTFFKQNALIRNVSMNNKKKKKRMNFHEMIIKEVQQYMQYMLKQSYQHHCLDDDSDIDESHQVEPMEDESSHFKKILDTKYKPADLDKIAHECDY
jgi:hypothetical protein